MTPTEAAIKYEHYETAPWATPAVLRVEPIKSPFVYDVCTGDGRIASAVKKFYNVDRREGKFVSTMDIHDWGYPYTTIYDFLKWEGSLKETTAIFNPPFSKACEFVEHALRLGAEKVICFQRMGWFESRERRIWFDMFPPDRIWLCGDRATCWRHDISPADRKIDPKTGKKRTGSTTPHAWFIFEAGSQSQQTVIDKIWKLKGEKS